MLGFVGETAMDTSAAGVTVSVVEPDILPETAVIVVEPAPAEVATPLVPTALLIDAMPVDNELHVTNVVMSCVVLSENVPTAVNCWLVPAAMVGLVGVTARDTSVADVTFNVVDPAMDPTIAMIVVLPTPRAITFICPGMLTAAAVMPAGLIVATLVSVEAQVADVVRSCVVLSE
jgi:hypothetical protein